MKKFLLKGIAAAAIIGSFVGCSKDVDLGGEYRTAEFNIIKNYEDAFITRFGQPAETQDWGFGRQASAATRATRSQVAPFVPHLAAPVDAAWVANYLTTAKEPNDNNRNHTYNGSHDAVQSEWVKTGEHWVDGQAAQWVVDVPASVTSQPIDPAFSWVNEPVGQIMYNWGEPSQDDKNFFNNTIKPVLERYNNYPIDYSKGNTSVEYVLSKNNQIDVFLEMYNLLETNNKAWWINVTRWPEKGVATEEQGHWTEATEGHMEEDGYWTQGSDAYVDEDFVLNFKITGTYSNTIPAGTIEGYALIDNGTLVKDLGESNGNARTIVVTGTWNISEEQRMGSGSKVIVANGGKINISANGQLNFVNQAQLVVLAGGEINGQGIVAVTNGNEEGSGSYNAGIISVATFNNNFGKFYNYNDFLVTEYHGGAQESNFYNHHLVRIDHFAGTGSTANARIFNACQFYVVNDARIRNYEGINGSALIVGGQLLCSSSEDGTGDPTYVGLAEGAVVKCGSLYNNGTSWTGPTSGYAALEIIR